MVTKTKLETLLKGKDLRSIGRCKETISNIGNKKDFDRLFAFLFHNNRIVVMHAADAIEKITVKNPQYLEGHRKEIFELMSVAKNKELKWHLALLSTRLKLKSTEFANLWRILLAWANNQEESRLARVAAIQGLYEIARRQKKFMRDFDFVSGELIKENIPSVNARIRNIRKEIGNERQSSHQSVLKSA